MYGMYAFSTMRGTQTTEPFVLAVSSTAALIRHAEAALVQHSSLLCCNAQQES